MKSSMKNKYNGWVLIIKPWGTQLRYYLQDKTHNPPCGGPAVYVHGVLNKNSGEHFNKMKTYIEYHVHNNFIGGNLV